MKHYGDITKISGYDLPIVDVITGGSPCQDVSIAGARDGFAGKRSSLFLEQIRIVKEMREHDRATGRADDLIRPRYMVWENVVGALSSPGRGHAGEDFQTVLTEIVRIADPDAPTVPMPEKNRWTKAGCIYDEMGRWSIAWRVHDSQFWGVPQRRKRIALVADFGGLSAPEVLFERKGLSWHPEPGEEKRQTAAGGTGSCIDSSVWRGGLKTENPGGVACAGREGRTFILENHPNDSRIKICEDDIFQSLTQRMGTGGNNVPLLLHLDGEINEDSN